MYFWNYTFALPPPLLNWCQVSFWVPLALTRPNILPSGALLQLCAVSVPRQGPSVAHTQLCVFCLPRMQPASKTLCSSRNSLRGERLPVAPHSDSPFIPAPAGRRERVFSTSSSVLDVFEQMRVMRGGEPNPEVGVEEVVCGWFTWTAWPC